MGVTIFYKGILKQKIKREDVLDIIQDVSKSLEWNCENFKDDKSDLLGVFLNLHPDCESLNFIFTNSGLLVNLFMFGFNSENKVVPIVDSVVELCYCKTQFSSPSTHISIIKFLEFLKKNYFKKMEIVDEGGYLPDHDTEELIYRMDMVDKGMDVLELALHETDILKPGEITENADKLENKIERILMDAIVKRKSKKDRNNDVE